MATAVLATPGAGGKPHDPLGIIVFGLVVVSHVLTGVAFLASPVYDVSEPSLMVHPDIGVAVVKDRQPAFSYQPPPASEPVPVYQQAPSYQQVPVMYPTVQVAEYKREF